MKHGGLDKPDPYLLEERTYNISKAAREVLVGSLLEGTNLDYVAHKGCVRRASSNGRNQREGLKACQVNRRRPVHRKEGNGREKLLQEVWYRFYGNLSVYQTGP